MAKWGTYPPDEQLRLKRDAAEEMYEALRKIEAAGNGVLKEMDDYNEKHGTFLGGPAYFELGRSIANALNALRKARGEA